MINVTCAIIRNDENEVLVVQRGGDTDHPFKWEFPGGKVKDGESDEDCIIREIKEELSIDIVICHLQEKVEYDYGIKQIRLIPFVCDTLDELPLLTEHIAFKWVSPDDLKKIDFAEADISVAGDYLNTVVGSARDQETPAEKAGGDIEQDFRNMIGNMMGVTEADWVATSASENGEILEKLFDYSIAGDSKLAFRASWTLTKVFDKYPGLINNKLSLIVDNLDSTGNDSVKRSFLRIISLSDLTELTQKHHGFLAESCFAHLRSGFSPVAIKAYSMEIIYKLAIIYPELANELASTIGILENGGSAGIVARGRMILKKLAGLTGDQ